MSSSGIFEPGEFATILAIYKEIAAEPWFTRSPERQQAFARHMLIAYRTGMQSIEEFRLLCRAAARVSFAETFGSFSEVGPSALIAC
jgi:hypothetical protein